VAPGGQIPAAVPLPAIPAPKKFWWYKRILDNSPLDPNLNRRGGATSPSLCKLAKETWEWCMSQDITLKANHLPGHLNTVADKESRTGVGLEASPQHISKNQPDLETLCTGSVCIETNIPTTSIL